jgi:hypothetical protein
LIATPVAVVSGPGPVPPLGRGGIFGAMKLAVSCRPRRIFHCWIAILSIGWSLAACVRAYDLVVDNRTVTSLTMRVYSMTKQGTFSQFPDRIFSLPPNREFRIPRAIVSTRHGDRRLFEFRRPDEQLVDSFVMTYAEIERNGGRITVPRSLAAIPRVAPPAPADVDSTPQERIDYIPLYPEDSAKAGPRP